MIFIDYEDCIKPLSKKEIQIYEHLKQFANQWSIKIMAEERCTCSEEYIKEHTCPYQEDINNDSESTCNCCDYCTYQCAMDI